jgi:hypothetical protein
VRADTRLPPGLYRIYWTSGGSSLAAVGCAPVGRNWIAPINWTRSWPADRYWSEIERIEPIVDPDEWYAREVERMKERAPA